MTSIPPSGEALLEAARRLRPLIENDSPQIERDRRLTPAVVGALSEAGLYRMVIPASLGGSELSPLQFSRVLEQLAQADASTAWCVAQNSGISRYSAFLPREGAREIFADPETIVSSGNGPGVVRQVEGGYLMTCKAAHSSGVHHATWLGYQDGLLYDKQDNPVFNKQGEHRKGVGFFRQPDAEISDIWHVSGLRGTGSDNFEATDLFIPEHRLIEEDSLEPGPLYLFSSTNLFAIGFSSIALGLARASLDSFIELTNSKTPRGTQSTMRDQSRVQGAVGRAEATWRSARALLHETLDGIWDTVCQTHELTMELRISLRMATTFAIQRSAEVVDTAYTTAGVNAIFENNAFERRFRDMHAVTQHIQGRDDHFEKIGQFLMGIEPDWGWL